MTHGSELFKTLIENREPILMEASVNELVRRRNPDLLDPLLVNTSMIYSEEGRQVLEDIYKGYLKVAKEVGGPFILCAPTWRANRERVAATGYPETILDDTIDFMNAIRGSEIEPDNPVFLSGSLGVKNDAYNPAESLPAGEAYDFHSWQVEKLAPLNVDFLMAVTIPAPSEAIGLARAMAASGLPYIISFVIGRDGNLLDGTSLETAITIVEEQYASEPPVCYSVNCSYPTFLSPVKLSPAVSERLMMYQANSSALDHCDLDKADAMCAEPVDQWAEDMVKVAREFDLSILGGCCGTTDEHLRQLHDQWKSAR